MKGEGSVTDVGVAGGMGEKNHDAGVKLGSSVEGDEDDEALDWGRWPSMNSIQRSPTTAGAKWVS